LPDVICGGFPCQDVSNAGKRKGIHGERSGLWTEFARIIGRLSPKYAIIENSAGIASRGLDLVIRDLAEMRYDAEWFRLRASSFGAAHRRERVYIVAYPSGVGLEGWFTTAEKLQEPVAALADTRDWPTLSEPLSLRSTHGVPDYVDRINAIGNAVVPACARWIGEQILKFEAEGRPKDEEC
jgi:DNA (cytosine-5)-methyltransferase 1